MGKRLYETFTAVRLKRIRALSIDHRLWKPKKCTCSDFCKLGPIEWSLLSRRNSLLRKIITVELLDLVHLLHAHPEVVLDH